MDEIGHNAVAVEAFNTICTNLSFLGVDSELKKIVVTSSVKGEGKTTVTTNIAYFLASLNKKVLLIDGDLRNPSVHRMFSLPNRMGLSDVILSQHNLEGLEGAVVEHSAYLHILTAGHRPPNPTELLSSKRMSFFLEEAATVYDYVLIDSPPVLLIPDAVALTGKTDGILLVTRHGYTTKDMLKSTKEALAVVNAKPTACILNCIPASHKSYSRYGYDYYNDPTKKHTGRARKKGRQQ